MGDLWLGMGDLAVCGRSLAGCRRSLAGCGRSLALGVGDPVGTLIGKVGTHMCSSM